MTREEIKSRLSNIGEAIGDIALEYISKLEKENTELDCQKNRNKFCYSCTNATERCFRNEIGCPCEKYKSYKEENKELKAYNEKLLDSDIEKHNKIVELQRENEGLKAQIEKLKPYTNVSLPNDTCYKCEKELSIENRASVILTSNPPKYLCKECAGEKEVEKHKWDDILLGNGADYDKKIAKEYTTLQEQIEQLEKRNAELKEHISTLEQIKKRTR